MQRFIIQKSRYDFHQDRWWKVYKTKDDEFPRNSVLFLLHCCFSYHPCLSQFILSHFFFFVFLVASSPSPDITFPFIKMGRKPLPSRTMKNEVKKAFNNSDGINIHHDIKWTTDLQMWMYYPRREVGKVIIIHKHKCAWRRYNTSSVSFLLL